MASLPTFLCRTCFIELHPFLPFHKANLFVRMDGYSKNREAGHNIKKIRGRPLSLRGRWVKTMMQLLNKKIGYSLFLSNFLIKGFFLLFYISVLFSWTCVLYLKKNKQQPSHLRKRLPFLTECIEKYSKEAAEKKKKMSAGLCHCLLKGSGCLNGTKKNNVHPK